MSPPPMSALRPLSGVIRTSASGHPRTEFDPIAVISRVEILQRSSLLPDRGVNRVSTLSADRETALVRLVQWRHRARFTRHE